MSDNILKSLCNDQRSVIKLNMWRYYRNVWYEGMNSKDEILTVKPQELDISFEEAIDGIEALKIVR